MVRYNVRNTTNYVWVKTPGSVRTLTLTGLLPNTSYDWAVRCICASAPSQAYSSTNTFTTLSSSCGTADVAYFSSTLITHNSATVGWRSVSGALSHTYGMRFATPETGRPSRLRRIHAHAADRTPPGMNSRYKLFVPPGRETGLPPESSKPRPQHFPFRADRICSRRIPAAFSFAGGPISRAIHGCVMEPAPPASTFRYPIRRS